MAIYMSWYVCVYVCVCVCVCVLLQIDAVFAQPFRAITALTRTDKTDSVKVW